MWKCAAEPEPVERFRHLSELPLAPIRPEAAPAEYSVIPAGITVKGEIEGSQELRIEGRVEGLIRIPENKVTIGVRGQVEAAIQAREILVMGNCRGNLLASERIQVFAEASAEGELTAGRLCVDAEARIKGRISTQGSHSPVEMREVPEPAVEMPRRQPKVRRELLVIRPVA